MSSQKNNSYQDLKQQLDAILARLESDEVDIDEAVELHKKGQQITSEIEQYLKEVKAKIDIKRPEK